MQVVLLVALTTLSCGGRTEDVQASNGGSPGTGGTTAIAGTTASGGQTAPVTRSGRTSVTVTGIPCVEDVYHGGVNDCPHELPVPCKPCIACDPLPPGDASGCAAPDFAFYDWPGGGVDTSLYYPVGCAVQLPTENLTYPGAPQGCGCAGPTFIDVNDGWLCPN